MDPPAQNEETQKGGKKRILRFTAGIPPSVQKSLGLKGTAAPLIIGMMGGGCSTTMKSPLLYPARLADKPKFSGLKGDWFTFEKEREGYVETI